MAWQVDLGQPEYVSKLGRIPAEFRGLVCQHLEETASRIGEQGGAGSTLLAAAMDSTIDCVLSGVASMRWYLLYSPERIAAAKSAWAEDGVMGVALYLRELNKGERVLLVSGYGHASYESVELRLSSLKATMGISLVATTHGPLAEWVCRWATETGVPYAHLPLEDDANLIERISAQCLEAVELFSPVVVCALTSERPSMRLVEIAAQRKVPRIVSPDPVSPLRAVHSSPGKDAPAGDDSRSRKRYVALAKPSDDGA